MARGILYVMSTVVEGLVKIGKTGKTQFEGRMNHLEKNGYCNVTGLKREFAIEVDEYDEKEKLLHIIFTKSRIAQTELFAADLGVIKKLLSSFDGEEVYPKNVTKEEVFEETKVEEEPEEDDGDVEEQEKVDCPIPDGFYYLNQKRKDFGPITATLEIKNGHMILKAGSTCAPANEEKHARTQRKADIQNNELQEDLECTSVSTAGEIVLGKSVNGWVAWKDKSGKPVDQFRSTK